MGRPEEGEVGHHDHGRRRAATGEDGEGAIDHPGEGRGGSVAEDEGAMFARGHGDVVAVGGDEHAIDRGGALGGRDHAIEERAGDLVAPVASGGGEPRLAAGEAARRHDGPRAAEAQVPEGLPDHRPSSSANAMTSRARRTRSSREVITVRVAHAATPAGGSSPSSRTRPVTSPA